MSTKILQGIPPLLKVCTDPLTEGNNRDFVKGSSLRSFFCFFGLVSVPITEDNNQDFLRGSPTEFIFPLVKWIGLPLDKKVVSFPLTEDNN